MARATLADFSDFVPSRPLFHAVAHATQATTSAASALAATVGIGTLTAATGVSATNECGTGSDQHRPLKR